MQSCKRAFFGSPFTTPHAPHIRFPAELLSAGFITWLQFLILMMILQNAYYILLVLCARTANRKTFSRKTFQYSLKQTIENSLALVLVLKLSVSIKKF